MSYYTGYSIHQNTLLNGLAQRITSAEDAILNNKGIYDNKVAAIDLKDAEQDGRLTSVEGRVSTVENNISVQVSEVLTTSEAQVTFDSLKTEIENVESALTASLATKVAQTVQTQVDAAQDALIATKVAQTAYDTKMTQLDAKNTALDSLNGKWENRFLAVEEFINGYLKAFILKINGTPYAYNAKVQQIPGIQKSPFFTVVSKTAINTEDWKITLQFNDYSYNAFLGSVVCQTGGSTFSITKTDINSTTYVADLVLTGTRSNTSFTGTFPFDVTYRNVYNETVFTASITQTAFEAL